MNVGNIISLARDYVDDIELPYLWSDSILVSYLNKRLNELCEEAWLIIDSTTSAICSITLISGTAKYTLDSRIIHINRAKITGEANPLDPCTTRYLDINLPDWEATSDIPKRYVLDSDSGKILLHPKPNAAGTLNLSVVRLPLAQITIADFSVVPEISIKYHEELVNGILSLAYLKKDADTYDPKKAAEYLTYWTIFKEQIKRDLLKENYKEVVASPLRGTI